MNPIPELKTNRLTLRPFTLADAPMVQKLAGEYEVARRTLNIPYPYEDGVAEKWISKHADLFAKMEQVI
ncbi:MAG: GNAT family N-acetyltransferase, partial [candidate division KSB1 bacterium]|nr:GNAT family N-acetyltransferase [candidate division KSB1 bacterium]